jgi:hypothetical protein
MAQVVVRRHATALVQAGPDSSDRHVQAFGAARDFAEVLAGRHVVNALSTGGLAECLVVKNQLRASAALPFCSLSSSVITGA